MWLFVNAMIENPAFDSQTKECLNTKKSQFGSKPVLSEEFFKKGASRRILRMTLTNIDASRLDPGSPQV